MLFSLLLAALPFLSRSQTCTTDRDALMALYNSTNGANWTNKTNWGSSSSICNWYGVTCQTPNNPTVVGLELNNNNLKGSIPAEIGCLKNLKSLYMNNNDFTGSAIPSELFSGASSLQYLQLNNNNLSGPIPNTLCTDSFVAYLYLDGNNFNSSIPCSSSSYPVYLREFHGSCSNLTGTLPTWFKNLRYITEVKINCNNNFLCPTPSDYPNIPVLQCSSNCSEEDCENGEPPIINPTQCPEYVDIENCGRYFRSGSGGDGGDGEDPDIPVVDNP